VKYQLELEHPDLQRTRLFVNGQQLIDVDIDKKWNTVLDIRQSTKIELWFWPWKIKPLLRLNGHLLDYSLARVSQYDHMLCFDIDKNYFKNYGLALVQSRVESQFKGGAVDENIYDAVIGHGRRHLDLIDKIKSRIE
jgi:hypothetical protein